MNLLILAAAATLASQPVQPAQEDLGRRAFAIGYCHAYVDIDSKVQTLRFINSQDSYLAGYLETVYYGGIQKSRQGNPSLRECKSLLTDYGAISVGN